MPFIPACAKWFLPWTASRDLIFRLPAQQDGHANHGLFVGYAPYDDPEITIAVRIANGYNSHNAATAARNVISYYYKETSMKDIKEMKAAGANGNIRNSVAD